jgi:hypothetical protein
MGFHLVFFWVLWSIFVFANILWSILVLQTFRQFASMMDVYLGGTLMFICGGLFEYIDA